MNSDSETIVAQATPPGKGGVGVIRVSGSLVDDVISELIQKNLQNRYAHYVTIRGKDGQALDQGIALLFKGPHSFTGEDVLELHAHGGVVVIKQIIQCIIELGARLARPGEFSERAFLNGKIDLTQAEAIADLIDAHSEQAARLALRSLEGKFSEKIKELLEKLKQLRIFVEASIDFPEEEIDFLEDRKLYEMLKDVENHFSLIFHSARRSAVYRDGFVIGLAGEPNAGKSSLLNALCQKDLAIVTDVPGTTRDLIQADCVINGIPIRLIDTAGIRESQDIVEKEGIKRTLSALTKVDHIFYVIDAAKEGLQVEQELLGGNSKVFIDVPNTVLLNKIDLLGQEPFLNREGQRVEIGVSAKTSAGLDLLEQIIGELVETQGGAEAEFIARERHINALETMQRHMDKAKRCLQDKAGELMAEELKLAQRALSEITGEYSSDQLLGDIFSSFCIGK